MTFAWKAAGLSYNGYLAVASRVLRQCLREDRRLTAMRAAETEIKITHWKDGKQGEPELLSKIQAAIKQEDVAA